MDEDGDPLFQRRSQDERAKGFSNLSVEGLLAYKKAVEDHKTRADKVVTLNAAFMKTYVYAAPSMTIYLSSLAGCPLGTPLNLTPPP